VKESLRYFQIRRGFPATFAHNVEADALTFSERGQAGTFDRTDVHKHILAACAWLNEAEALLGVEPFHCTAGHVGLL